MERTPENIREFKEKAVAYIDEMINALVKIDFLCTEEGYDSDDGEYMGWFNDYLLPPYDGKEDAYPFNMDYLEQINEIMVWRDSIIASME